jgi:VWFA-related protein
MIALVVLALCAMLRAQAAAQQPKIPLPRKTPEATTMRVTTRLVQLNVIVLDRKGQPVADLQREDFSVFDGGDRQEVSVFSMETVSAAPASASNLPPGTFSNRAGQRSGVPTSVTVILLDAINTRTPDQQYARQQVAKFLSQLRPEDRVALYLLHSRSVRILHDFTADTSRLLRALERYRGGVPRDPADSLEDYRTGYEELDSLFEDANRRMQNFYIADRARATTAALEAIANHLAGVAGRKNLLWVSSSFPINIGYGIERQRYSLSTERISFFRETERAARALSNANVAVYPVDAQGLVVVPGGVLPTVAGSRGTPRAPQPVVSTLGSFGATHDTMNFLARRTGGRAFYNRNDLDSAIRSAIDDSRVTYTLGFYPTHGRWNGKFRDLKVRVARPGLRLLHRAGYYAANEPPADESSLLKLLAAAAHSPLEATALAVTARIEESSAAGQIRLVIELEPKELSLHIEEGRWVGAIDTAIVQQTREGANLDVETYNMAMRLIPETYERLLREGLNITRTVRRRPGSDHLRIVVRDAATGSMGSLRIPLP